MDDDRKTLLTRERAHYRRHSCDQPGGLRRSPSGDLSALGCGLHEERNSDHAYRSSSFLRRVAIHLSNWLSESRPLKKEMIMTTLIRSVLVAAALLGTVSAVSAAPRDRTNPYAYDNSYTSGAIDDFNRLTHKSD
jgi:hypothetical protein